MLVVGGLLLELSVVIAEVVGGGYGSFCFWRRWSLSSVLNVLRVRVLLSLGGSEFQMIAWALVK